jgi:hypothetical protein
MSSAMVAPPKTPASVPTSVMPTWTVDRTRFGSPTSSRAAAAPRSPLPASIWRRGRRAEMMASSARENRPLTPMSTRMTATSLRMADTMMVLWIVAGITARMGRGSQTRSAGEGDRGESPGSRSGFVCQAGM